MTRTWLEPKSTTLEMNTLNITLPIHLNTERSQNCIEDTNIPHCPTDSFKIQRENYIPHCPTDSIRYRENSELYLNHKK